LLPVAQQEPFTILTLPLGILPQTPFAQQGLRWGYSLPDWYLRQGSWLFPELGNQST
jgi:hypothetical protein